MDIRDAQGGLPTTAIATFSQAGYQAADLPSGPGTLQWTIAGTDPGAVIQGPATGVQVTVVTLHRSASVGDIQLVVTFTPGDMSPPTVVKVALTVFAAEIRDAGNTPTPTLDIGVGNRVNYRPVVVPALPSADVFWRVGQNGRVAITSQSPTGEIGVTGQSASLDGRDGTLTLMIRIGEQQATATVGLGVFDVRIGLDRVTPWVGVGEVVVCSADVFPAGVIPPSFPVTAAWSVSQRFQLMGDPTGAKVSLVANAPSGSVDDDWVEVVLTWQGSTVRARRALTAIGVSIRGADQGDPPTSLGVGQSAIYRAVVEPPVEDVLALWMTGRTATVEQDDLAARVTGVQASAFEGADGLAIHVFARAASTQALIPLTIVELTIRTT